MTKDGDEIMAIVIQKSKDEFEQGRRGGPTGNEASSQPPSAIKSSEMEMAKRIVYDSESIERSLQYEIDQQAYLNRKMIKHEIRQPGLETTNSATQARPASAAKRPESARKSKATGFETEKRWPPPKVNLSLFISFHSMINRLGE